MLRRHQIFNVILAFWREHNMSSTPRRGELRRLLAERNMKMSRTNLQQHLNGLVADGYISVEQGVITLPPSRADSRHAACDMSRLKSIRG